MKTYNLFETVVLKDRAEPNLAIITGINPIINHYIVMLVGWSLEDGSFTKLVHVSEIQSLADSLNQPPATIPNNNKITIRPPGKSDWHRWFDEYEDNNPPYTPYYPAPVYPTLPVPNIAGYQCGVCGRVSNGADMYSCPVMNCPSRTTSSGLDLTS